MDQKWSCFLLVCIKTISEKDKKYFRCFITQENGGQSMKLVVYKGFNEEFLSMVKEEPLVDGTIATKLSVNSL